MSNLPHPNNTHQVLDAEVMVCHHSLHLVELCQVSGIQCLVAVHTVNGEVFSWLEPILWQVL